MPKEPYNLFAGVGSTLPGGTAYEDLLVILKAVVIDSGGMLEIDEEYLMFVDRDEMLRVDDLFIDGRNRKVFSIQTKERNQNPEGCVTHETTPEPDENQSRIYRFGRLCGFLITLVVLFSFLYLVGQITRWAFF